MTDWVLVTGGAQGLGEAIALHLARSGYAIALHHNTSSPERTLAACRGYGVEAQSIKGDFSSPKSVETFLNLYLRRFPRTRGIVYNIGAYALSPPSKSVSAALMQRNLFAAEQIISALIPSLCMLQGHVVNIGSAGIARPSVQNTAYAVTKAALWKYTLSLAQELEEVKVNMVSPGVLENSIDTPTEPIPFEEVARLVAFLFTSDCITGQNIEVAARFRL